MSSDLAKNMTCILYHLKFEGEVLRGPFVVNGSSQTSHEVFVEVSPLDQQRALYAPLHCLGSKCRRCRNTVFTQYQKELCRFLFEIHKNIENMDCTTGFHVESYEYVWSQTGRDIHYWSSAHVFRSFPFPSSRMVLGWTFSHVVQNPFSNHLVEFYLFLFCLYSSVQKPGAPEPRITLHISFKSRNYC